MNDLIKDAQDRFEESQQNSDFNREAYYEDIKFARLNEQWPSDVQRQRQQEGRPCLTINKLPSLIRAVVNESRQNKPAIKVSPVDNGADEETAQVIGGLIRSVERNSSADIAYNTALDNAVTGGMGFFRVDIDYVHNDSFELEARIKRIPNSLQVHWDVSSTEFDASDWNYAFVSDVLRREEFERRYPKASVVSFDSSNRDSDYSTWLQGGEHIRIAEYFKRTLKQRKLIQFRMPDGSIRAIREEHIPYIVQQTLKAGGIEVDEVNQDLINVFVEMSGAQVLRERQVDYHEVTKHLINGVEELEESSVWPGESIPICPVWGDEVMVDGRRYFRSMIADAKDPQRMFNFWRSATTELVALSPKTPFIGPRGFVPKGQEDKWASANTRSHAYLEYDGPAPPQRQAFAGVPAGALQEALNASDDMKAITGIFDSSIGARSNETSGKAILARERQGDVANFHFQDNLNRAIQYCGRILVEIIPAVYSDRETIRILGEDDKEKVVKLTQQAGGSPEGKLYNLTVGKYDVTVSAGPSYGTQREETRETLIEIMRQVPNAAPFIGDALMDHMDFVGADKLAKRLTYLLPPEVRAMESEEVQNSENPELAAMQQQMRVKEQQVQQMMQQAQQAMQKLQSELEAMKTDRTVETQRLQVESQVKMRELAIKEEELRLKANEPTELKFEYDAAMQEDRQQFEAEENERNRLFELAKAIVSKMPDASEMQREEVSQAALRQAMKVMNAPVRVIHDEEDES